MVHESSFPKSSIEYSESKPGFVTLTGKVESSPYPFDKLAVMLFVWRFAPMHARKDDHGWCEASPHDYGPGEHGEWTVTDVPSGVQYAVLVVEGEYFMRSTHPDPLVELIEKLNDDSGAIPMKGL